MATTPLAPGLWPVALDGHPFVVDLDSADGGFVTQSIPLLRGQADQGARPGEQSINPDDLWRRSVESWHHGAGQGHADRAESDPYKFRASLHLNPWNRFALSPLPLTGVTSGTGAATRSTVCVAGDKLFFTNGVILWMASAVPGSGVLALTAISGTPAGDLSIASDGALLYVIGGGTTNDVRVVDPATGTASMYAVNGTVTVELIRFAKDRLLLFDNAGSVYDISTGTIGTALFTHRLGARWVWTDATDGLGFIYLSGYTGTGSEAHGVIYRVGILDDGTGLDVPIIAARLPDGEQALAVQGYLGLMFIGTSLGARVCLEQSGGSLRIGDLIPTGPCLCFEPQGSQVWFGWTGSAAQLLVGGLGRIDLSDYNFADGGAPPYASDLAPVGGASAAMSVVTFLDKRIFATVGGLYAERTALHDQGRLLSGVFGFDLTSPKTFHYLHVKGDNNAVMAVNAYVDDNDARLATMGLARTNLDITDAQPDGTPSLDAAIFDLTGWRADQLEYKLDTYSTINRVTLLARPAITARSEQINVTLLVADEVDVNGQDEPVDVNAEVQHIRSLMQKGAPVEFQAGAETYKVIVEDYRFIRTAGGVTGTGTWRGAVQVQMKRFDTVTPIFRGVRTDTVESGTTLTVDPPDGVLPGDVLYAAMIWDSSTYTLSPEWTLLDDYFDGSFESATFVQTGTALPFDPVFNMTTTGAAAVLAYTQGDNIESVFTAHELAPTEFVVVNDFVNDSIAAVATTAVYQPLGDFKVGAARSRVRVSVGDFVLEVGDALSTSTFSSDDPGYPGDVTDALTAIIPVPASGAVRVWVDKLVG